MADTANVIKARASLRKMMNLIEDMSRYIGKLQIEFPEINTTSTTYSTAELFAELAKLDMAIGLQGPESLAGTSKEEAMEVLKDVLGNMGVSVVGVADADEIDEEDFNTKESELFH